MTTAVRAVAFSPDGTKIATASWDRTARLWDAATGKPLGTPMKHDERGDGRGLQPGRQEARHRELGQNGPAVGRGDGQTARRSR